jgi:hypothetical protein
VVGRSWARTKGWAAAAAAALLLTGCSSTGGAKASAPPSTPTAQGSLDVQSATPGAPGRFRLDPARVPTTAAAALELARATAAGPIGFGPRFVQRTPFESDATRWPVLGSDCVWRLQPLPGDVLASLTRYSRMPAAAGKGEVHTAATVTVHRTVAQADWEMAGTLEQALRCPDQQLRQTERITGLNSVGSGFGAGGNTSADDYLMEVGGYVNPALGQGDLPYYWAMARLGPVTVAVAVDGGQKLDPNRLIAELSQAMGAMESKVRTSLGASS